MRCLLLQLFLLLGGVGLVAGAALVWTTRQPYLDAFYARFTTPPAASLVLGTSRAAQAVRPAVLRARLGGQYEGPWLNYAFTLTHSPFGPAYLASIGRKLAPATRHGLFVVAVDPWSLSLPNEWLRKRPAGSGFPEDSYMLSQVHEVSQNPNLDYLRSQLTSPYYRLLLRGKYGNPEYLHPDGWLEVGLPSPLADPARQQRREADKLATYRQTAATSALAPARLASLRALLTLLRAHGRVVLTRLPTGPRMAALEADYAPDFDQRMAQLSAEFYVPYLNYLHEPYLTNDGNHLWRGETERFSERLAADIGLGEEVRR